MPMPIIRGSQQTEYWFEEGCFITEWLNDPADPDISVARARVRPGEITRWHSLADTTERYLILSGQGRVEIGDQPASQLTTGDSVCIQPGERQRIASTGGEDLVFLAICTPRFTPACYQPQQDGPE